MLQGPRLLSTVHVLVYLAFSVAWVLAMGVVTAVAMLAAGVPERALGDPARLVETLGGVGLGAITIVQITGMAVAAWIGARALPGSRASAFPLGRPSPWLLGAAVIGGLTLWTLPSWIAEHLMDHVDAPTMPEMLVELLRTGSIAGRAVIAFAIGVSAPLCEEVVFRGYLWRAVELGWGRWCAWIVTSVLFVLSHLDPVQSVSLVPVALFIGWLRLRSGSLGPSIAAHFTNNALGLLLAVGPMDEEAIVGLPLAVAGLAIATVAGAVASRYAPPAPALDPSSSST